MRPVCLHCIPSTFSKNACCGEGESHAFLYRVEGLDPLSFRTQRKGDSKHGQHCDCFHADIIAQKHRLEPSPLYLVFDSEAVNLRIAGVLGSIDEKIELNRKKIAELEALAKTIYVQYVAAKQCTFTTVGKEVSVVTGKRDSNFATADGGYRFFTCSKERLMCDEYEFEGKAILLSGNGDLHAKFYSGKFNAYQRTYVLIPRKDALFSSMYFAVQSTLTRLTSGAAGSIVKFITKGDVENIVVPEFSSDIQKVLNNVFDDILSTESEIEVLIKGRDALLPLLMNGQVEVAG